MLTKEHGPDQYKGEDIIASWTKNIPQPALEVLARPSFAVDHPQASRREGGKDGKQGKTLPVFQSQDTGDGT